jgi:transcriptional regulator with XRE-family HTH domain
MRRTKLLPKQAEGSVNVKRERIPEMEHSRSSVEEVLETDQGRCEFAKEELAFEATEKIAELMELTNVSKSELAKRTGNSKAYITQVLSGSRNMTVHTLAGLAFALGYKITFNASPISCEIVTRETGADLKMVLLHSSLSGVQTERAEPAPGPLSKSRPSIVQSLPLQLAA